ncbi:MAG: glycosyl hydrolase [Pirellulaceae bacterium]
MSRSWGQEATTTAGKQPVDVVDADTLRAAFQDPPASCRPLVIMHAGALHSPDLLAWLAARRTGGVVLDAGIKPGTKDLGDEPWDNPTYLDDPAQFEKLRGTVKRLRNEGACVWLYDELGYPSGSAGGRVLQGHPEFQVEVVGCRTLHGTTGEQIDVVPEQGSVEACVALPMQDGQLVTSQQIDLTEKAREGKFTWQVPSDRWVVCLFERFQPDTWRRHNIPRRNVNILDRRAVERFITLTHDRYDTELGEQIREIQAFFTDEPQFGSAEHWGGGLPQCIPMVQWCDELPELFRRKTGYEVHTILPALFHAAGPATAKFRHDFYDVQSDLVAENYFGQIETKCRALGVPSSGHMLLEESLLFHVMFSGSMLKNWARMDLPGIDLLGATPYHTMGGWGGDFVPVPEDFSCKLASSVTHLLGKQGTFTESFALAESASLRQVLGITAWQFAGGVTHMSTYSIQRSLSAEDYAAFCDFAGRLAWLARRGRHVADVAVLVPESAVWATYTPPDGGGFLRYLQCNPEPVQIDRVFRETCHNLLKQQRDFDCLSEDLLQRATVRDKRLHLADESFPILILPEMRMIRRDTLSKLHEFLASGGHVAFVGSLPRQTPSRGDDPSLTQEVADLMGAFPDHTLHVPDAHVVAELLAWLDVRVPRLVQWQGPTDVRLLHRQESDRDLLLVANPSPECADGQLTSPSKGTASVWDPETGNVRMIGPTEMGAAIPLSVPPESARFLVVER